MSHATEIAAFFELLPGDIRHRLRMARLIESAARRGVELGLSEALLMARKQARRPKKKARKKRAPAGEIGPKLDK